MSTKSSVVCDYSLASLGITTSKEIYNVGFIKWCSAALLLFSKNPTQVVYGNHEGITLVQREYIGTPNYIRRIAICNFEKRTPTLHDGGLQVVVLFTMKTVQSIKTTACDFVFLLFRSCAGNSVRICALKHCLRCSRQHTGHSQPHLTDFEH